MWCVVKVLSEYPEAKMTDEQQKEALGETYSELVSRLDEGITHLLVLLLYCKKIYVDKSLKV